MVDSPKDKQSKKGTPVRSPLGDITEQVIAEQERQEDQARNREANASNMAASNSTTANMSNTNANVNANTANTNANPSANTVNASNASNTSTNVAASTNVTTPTPAPSVRGSPNLLRSGATRRRTRLEWSHVLLSDRTYLDALERQRQEKKVRNWNLLP